MGALDEERIAGYSGGFEGYVELVVTLVTFVLLSPVLLALLKSMRLYTSIDTVLLEGMIFRPMITPRFTMDNLAATWGFVIEFFSHVNAGMTSDYLGYVPPSAFTTWTGAMHTDSQTTATGFWNGTEVIPSNVSMPGETVVVSVYAPTDAVSLAKKVTEGNESLPQMAARLYAEGFSICFWVSAILVLSNYIIFTLRLTLPGKFGWFWTNETLYAELLWAEVVRV